MGIFTKQETNKPSAIIVKEGFPPNIEAIKKVFDIKKGTIFTYGNEIYVYEGRLDPPLFQHELVHVRQQNAYGVEKWWDRYLVDPAFRLSQEIEAYQVQYRYGRGGIKDRNKLAVWRSRLATELSGSLYGNMISFQDAMKAIESETSYVFKV